MSSKFKAVIVDDEKLARLDLKNILKSFNEIEIVGEANNINLAEQLINKFHPSLVFLDIQLRGETGFDLINKIDFELDFVFVTAFDKYALRAFEVNALDYLLKPINIERLKQTIDKLKNKSIKENESINKLNYNDVLYLMLNNKYRFLKIESIVAITSNADYTFIYTDEKNHFITRKTMKEWENRLPEKHFCRIHRETIINLDFISNLDDSLTDSSKIFLRGFEKPFSISRRYSVKLKEKFV